MTGQTQPAAGNRTGFGARLAAACAKKEPEFAPTPAPVTTEPVYQGKFGAN